MVEFKAKVISIEYHKPEYHVNIEIYIDGVLNSDTTVNIPDDISIDAAKEMVKDKLREIKASLTLGHQLNTYIEQEIIL